MTITALLAVTQSGIPPIPTGTMRDLQLVAPEVLVALGAMSLLMLGVILGERSARVISQLSVILLLVAGAIVWTTAPEAPRYAFDGAFVVDPLSVFAKTLITVAAAAGLLLSGTYLRSEKIDRFEYPVIIVLATLGMMVMVSARDLITMYLGVEMQSLALYVLAAFNRDSLRASEAGLKYFVLGALSSGLLLYGASLAYGFAGSTLFADIALYAGALDGPDLGLIFAMVFIACGLAFKVSAAPFHMWTPDVYEGAPTPVTAFFAAAPKIAAMALFVRVLVDPFGAMHEDWSPIIAAMAVLSMLIGSFGALAQRNIKRLMAYSSIANMGYALVAVSATTARGVEGMLVFMTIYLVSTIGIFACILSMRRREGMVESIDDLAGLSKTHPGLAVALTALVLSIAGIPPLAGFLGKFWVFVPAVESGSTWLVVVAVLASVVSAFYYLRIVKLMWMETTEHPLSVAPRELALIASVTALAVFPLMMLPFVFSEGLGAISAAANGLFQ